MSEAEDKLSSILSNPQLMQQIMALAQSLNQQSPPQSGQAPKKQEPPATIPTDMDLSLLKKFAGFARQSSIDKDQQALLRALSPFLSRDRISKLERAMHAARIAQMASSFLNSGGLQLLSGR